MYFQVIGHWGFFLTGFVERLFSHLIKFVWHALVMQVFTEAKLTNHHFLLPSNRSTRRSRGTAWQTGRKHVSWQICDLFRMQKITDLNRIATVCPGDTFIYMFSSSYCPFCFFESLVDPGACWLQQWSVRLIFIHCCLQIHMIVFSFLCLQDSKGDLYSKCLPWQYILQPSFQAEIPLWKTTSSVTLCQKKS